MKNKKKEIAKQKDLDLLRDVTKKVSIPKKYKKYIRKQKALLALRIAEKKESLK